MRNVAVFIVFAVTVSTTELSYGQAFAETSVIDSLKRELSKDKLDDTTYISLLAEIGEQTPIFRTTYWDTIVSQSKKALSKAGLTPKAKQKLMRSLAGALNNKGYIYVKLGDEQNALMFFRQSLKIKEQLGDKKGIATSLGNIGAIYDDNGDIANALIYYHRSLKIREEIGNKEGIAICLNNIGLIYEYQEDYTISIQYYQRALKIREELGNKRGIAVVLSNMGSVYDNQGDQSKALDYIQRSLKIREEIGESEGIASCLNNIGCIYKNLGDTQKALQHFQRSLKIRKKIGHKEGIAVSLANIGGIQLEAKLFGEAETTLQRSLQLGLELGSPARIASSSDQLYSLAKQQNNYKEALTMYELHIKMRDSLKNEETQKASIRQQTKYEFEKAQLVKEQEEKEKTRVLEEETSRRDNLQYSVILISLLVIGVLLAVIGKFSMSTRVAEGLIFFSFLIFFEFLLVLADPYIEDWSGGAPGIKLLFNAAIAALIFPAHAFFESKLKSRIVKG